MEIIVDNREKALIKLLNAINTDEDKKLPIKIEKLDLGDIIIRNQNGEDVLIMERKQIADLASSIRDGRYAEQSYRLNGISLHNHNVIYIIEGNIMSYSNKFTKVKPSTLYSSMFSLNYYKGFSVVRTISTKETADFILLAVEKMNREKGKLGYYDIQSGGNKDGKFNEPSNNYTDVVKKVKKDNVTKQNIGPIMLSQIPSVSVKTAEIIMNKYSTILNLVHSLENNKSCLDELTYKTESGQNRRLSKNAINNIINYLVSEEDNIIKIDI